MKKSRFTEEQIIKALKRQEGGEKVQDICRDLDISQQAFYKWKAKYGGLEVSEAQKLKALEDENRRLKQIVADQALDIQAIKFLLKKVLGPDGERKAVELVQEAFGMSQRRACRIVGADRSTVRYEKKPTDDYQILDRMKNLLEERLRFGCPRVHLVLRSEGLVQNHKRTERIYYGNGLQLKKRKPKRRVYKPDNPLPPLTKANSRWSMDFVHDNLASVARSGFSRSSTNGRALHRHELKPWREKNVVRSRAK